MSGSERAAVSARELRFDGTIDRRRVHREAVAEVLVTDWFAVGRDQFLVGLQWPRRHFFFRAEGDRPDVALVAESLRQITIMLAHEAYAVPAEYRFLMDRIVVRSTGPMSNVHVRPPEIGASVTVTNVVHRRDQVDALTTLVEMTHEGVVVASAEGYLRVLAPRIYERIRRSGPTYDAQHASGWFRGLRAGDVDRGVRIVRRMDGRSWTVEFDQAHPVLFDHPVDHVPGMLLVEAARQVAAKMARRTTSLSSFDGVYESFLELDRPLTVSVVDTTVFGGERTTRMVANQGGAPAVRITVVSEPDEG